jgi:hypothetical protein
MGWTWPEPTVLTVTSPGPGRAVSVPDVKRRLMVACLWVGLVVGLSWPDFGRTVTLNVAAYCVAMNTIPPGQRVYEQVGSVPETLYGSDGRYHGGRCICGSLARCWSRLRVTGLLLPGGQTDVVPTPGRYPAEDSETRAFAPTRLRTTAAETRAADSQRVGGAGTNCQKEDSRDASQENSAHTR